METTRLVSARNIKLQCLKENLSFALNILAEKHVLQHIKDVRMRRPRGILDKHVC